MTKEQEEAIKKLEKDKTKPLACGDIALVDISNLETVLNLIQQLEREKQAHIRIEQTYKKEYLDAKEEIEKKDKRISNLEYALLDMVMQFADRHKIKGCEYAIGTMGLSALELAFGELNLNNPTKIKEVDKMYTKLQKQYFEKKVEQ